jgi:hypothetical protein
MIPEDVFTSHPLFPWEFQARAFIQAIAEAIFSPTGAGARGKVK